MILFPPDAPRNEASLRVAFSGNRIDRQAETRSDDAAVLALERPDARLLVVGDGRICLRVTGENAFDPYFSRGEAEALGVRLGEAILLGHEAAAPVLAVPFDTDPATLADGIKAIDYRSVYVQDLIDRTALGALAQGAALVAWHQTHRFCGRCGDHTEMRSGGYKRVCGGCGREHFPRTDPVVIMLALRGDACLLGRGAHFPPGSVSCLAGFVEPGETIEAAVRREVLEESSVTIDQVVYHASQPWPFPYTLMIGCYAEATSEAITVDENELEECRWFSRAEVRQMLENRHPEGYRVPPGGAIANILIRDWAAGQ